MNVATRDINNEFVEHFLIDRFGGDWSIGEKDAFSMRVYSNAGDIIDVSVRHIEGDTYSFDVSIIEKWEYLNNALSD